MTSLPSMVAHVSNPSFVESGDQRIIVQGNDRQKSLWDPNPSQFIKVGCGGAWMFSQLHARHKQENDDLD
jgi:hypothetical protein